MAIDQTNPAVVKIRTKRLETIKKDMDANDKVRIMYTSKYAQTANYWKYFIGQIKGLTRQKVYDKKKESEAAFTAWVNADEKRRVLVIAEEINVYNASGLRMANFTNTNES